MHVSFINYMCINSVLLKLKKLHSKSAGLKTTQLGLFGYPALGKYWTEHMLVSFDPAGWFKRFTHHAGLFYLSHLLFKNYYIAGTKWAENKKSHTELLGHQQ